jgi:hypothetical protein
MTVIAVIGTSHVGAVRQGWDALEKDYPGIELRFFAAHSGLVSQMSLNRALQFGLPTTKGIAQKTLENLMRNFGDHKIDLASVDAVLRVGWSTNESAVAQLLSDFDCDGFNTRAGRPRMSRAAFEAFADALAKKAAEKRDAKNWSRLRLYVLPVPRIADSCANSSAENHAAWRTLAQNGGASAGLDHYAAVARQAFGAKGMTLILPPAKVFAASGLTKAEFCRNSYRLLLNEAHQEDDHVHMNATYGEIALRTALDRILTDSNNHTTGA